MYFTISKSDLVFVFLSAPRRFVGFSTRVLFHRTSGASAFRSCVNQCLAVHVEKVLSYGHLTTDLVKLGTDCIICSVIDETSSDTISQNNCTLHEHHQYKWKLCAGDLPGAELASAPSILGQLPRLQDVGALPRPHFIYCTLNDARPMKLPTLLIIHNALDLALFWGIVVN